MRIAINDQMFDCSSEQSAMITSKEACMIASIDQGDWSKQCLQKQTIMMMFARQTIAMMFVRVNNHNDYKWRNSFDRSSRSMLSIAMMFVWVNNHRNSQQWGSPERNKNKQKSTSLWFLSCSFLWANCKNVCTCNPQHGLLSLAGLDI